LSRHFPAQAILHVAASLLAGAASDAAPPLANARGCLERFDAARDYFPAKATLEAAQGFSVDYRRSYKVLTVTRAYPDGPPESYVLLQCGAPLPSLPAELAQAPVVRVPIRSMFSASTTHLPLLAALGHVDVLTGVSNAAWIMSPPVLERIRAGKVAEFGARGTIDVEGVIARRPDVFMAGGDQSPAYVALRAAGVPVVANVEWLEATPRGRAEWVKYLALFLNEEARAEELFQGVSTRYEAYAARVRGVPEAERPRVMTGKAAQGQFHIAGGRSYVARLIRDAGGRYVWGDDPQTGGALVDLESQLRRAADADVWINGWGWKDRAAMLSEEPRYAGFKAYRSGQVWVYERRTTPAGANDYWSRSVTRPDLVLADLITIFHPALMKDHELEWYVQVAR
jgi:iron complex transport system substrate-binding protein